MVKGMGGAMDLVSSGSRVVVTMEHANKVLPAQITVVARLHGPCPHLLELCLLLSVPLSAWTLRLRISRWTDLSPRCCCSLGARTQNGKPKILKECSLPLTGSRVVNCIITELVRTPVLLLRFPLTPVFDRLPAWHPVLS